jgi:pimeloyl-ACP methyl ester carboxylesterase
MVGRRNFRAQRSVFFWLYPGAILIQKHNTTSVLPSPLYLFMANQIENWSVLVGGGIQLAAKTFKGRNTHHLIMAHANGLHKELWEPIIDDMRKLGFDWTITTIDYRGHGDSLLGDNPHQQDWWISGVDTLLVINALKEKYKGPLTFVGMGHSFGAVALIAAEIISKGTFHTLLLTEPVILPGPPYNANDFLFSLRAAKRKESFTNMQEAIENFKSKKELYATWEKRCFDLHMTNGLKEDPASGKLFLKCAPATEAGFFRMGGVTGMNQHLDKLTNRVFLWYGGKSWWTEAYSHITLNGITNAKEFHKELFPQNDHFLPLQIPETIAQRAVQALLPVSEIRSKL